MTATCRHHAPEPENGASCHPTQKPDYLLRGGALTVALAYAAHLLLAEPMANLPWLAAFAQAAHALMNAMWPGILLGMVTVGLLSKVPREFVLAILGPGGGVRGVLRAAAAGMFLDLCSHGILMIGMKLYERGASVGQVVAFLLASPWNSFSLTLILITLIGLKWTLAILLLSMLVAVVSGALFDRLAARGVLPANPNRADLPLDFRFFPAVRTGLAGTRYDAHWFRDVAAAGVSESRVVLRWLLFGVALTALLRAVFPPEHFHAYFGPTAAGLGLTLLAATVIEVCSEGATPLAADLLTRAHAPGNAFAFLMAGVATDYTEIMALKDTAKSWKIALFLPLISVPQVVLIGWILNGLG